MWHPLPRLRTTGAKPSHEPPPTKEEAKLVMDVVKKTVKDAGVTMGDVAMIQVHCLNLSLTPLSTMSIGPREY